MTTHWTKEQQERYAELMRVAEQKPEECWLGYWCSDTEGYPMGFLATRNIRASVGAIHEVAATSPRACTATALHATADPLAWAGSRVWAVAIHGLRDDALHQPMHMVAGLRREIIGEVLPQEALDPRLGARLGRTDLSGADLSRGNLRRVDLHEANLTGANLSEAELTEANLIGADLRGAKLCKCKLERAKLWFADLRGADLRFANLSGAHLQRTDLHGANLEGVSSKDADLTGALAAQAPPGWTLVDCRLEREE